MLRNRGFAMGLMAVALGINLFDRWLIVLLLESIKRDLDLSDTELGFVTGLGTSLLALLLAIPIARLADRANRVSIAAFAMGAWALTGVAMAAVANFTHLVTARLLASLGDAGVDPPLRSLVGDMYPGARERTRAMFVLGASTPLASVVAFSSAGFLNDWLGWRTTFLCASAPGLLVAFLLFALLRDPRPRMEDDRALTDREPFLVTARLLWNDRVFRHLSYALCMFCIVGQGLAPWYGAFVMRVHDLSASALGVWFGLVFGIGGAIGLILGLFGFERWVGDDATLALRVVGLVTLIAYPFLLVFLLAAGTHRALVALLVNAALLSVVLPPMIAHLQRLVPDHARATAIAVVLTTANIIGVGLGPQSVGILSDLFAPRLGVADGLRLAMLIVSLAFLGATLHLFAASRSARRTAAATMRPISS